MITQEMLTAMTHDILTHAQSHLYDAFEILRVLDSGRLALDEKLILITSLKNHVGIIQGDAGRALNLIGD